MRAQGKWKRQRRISAVMIAAKKSFVLALLAVLAFGSLFDPVRAEETEESAADEEAGEAGPTIVEKSTRLPILFEDPDRVRKLDHKGTQADTGWLILNTSPRRTLPDGRQVGRRGYQVMEIGSPPIRTIIHSFDLDTLEPLVRREVRNFAPLVGGGRPNSPGVAQGGDVIHAVDEEGGYLFVGMTNQGSGQPLAGPDSSRLFGKVLVIDEAAFESASTTFSRDLPLPTGQETLAAHGLKGMNFREVDGQGKLVLLFASYSTAEVNALPTNRQVFDHYLTQWDVDGGADWLQLLEPCQRASLIAYNGGEYQLGILITEDAIYIGCQAATKSAAVVRIGLTDGAPSVPPAFETYSLPRSHIDVFADQAGERLFLKTTLGGEVWYAFDAATRSFVGAVTVANTSGSTSDGLDLSTGRLYSLVSDHISTASGGGGGEEFPVQGGLLVSDSRLTPVPEATFHVRELAYPALFRIMVDPPTRRLFVRRGNRGITERYVYPSTVFNAEAPVEPFYRVLQDSGEVPEQPLLSDLDSLTMDVDEAEGVTTAAYSMAASGYGTRVILTGGLSAASHRELERSESRCLPDDRNLALGSVDDVSLSNLVASARAMSLTADQTTRDDIAQPSGRCWPAAFGEPPGGEPEEHEEADEEAELDCSQQGNSLDTGLSQIERPWDNNSDCKDDFTAACSGDERSVATPERPARSFESAAQCALSGEAVQAQAAGALSPLPGELEAPVSVAFSTSEVRATRVPGEGSLTEVRSIARGIDIAGVGSIGVIMTEAEVRAAGRPKSAKTSFVRTMCGVNLPTLKVAGCITSDKKGRSSEQQQIVDNLNRVLGRNAQARLRRPDPELAGGTPGGYLAAIQRGAAESFSDEKISRDASTAVPGLELIFYRDDAMSGAGRQIYQFAGVKASSAYGISCLYGPAEAFETDTDTDTLETESDTATLETDTDTDTGGTPTGDGGCAQPPEAEPSRLSILLNDEAGDPLAGGVFEIHLDSDTDGVLGADDEVIEDGSCVTGDDGMGDCVFEELEPGAYVIEQTSAPPGYAKAPVFAHVVDPATDYTVTFTNLKSVAGVQINLTEDSAEAKPLAGGVFELFADDGDEILGQADVLYASCTTDETGACELEVAVEAPAVGADGDASGALDVVDDLVDAVCEPVEEAVGCVLDVPLGSYVVHQSTAPSGFATADDVGFTFDQPGQVATLTFVNGLAGSGATVEATPGTPDIPPTPPTEVLVWDEGGTPQPIVESKPLVPAKPSLSDRASDALTQVLNVPLEAFRFLFNNPREVGLMAAVWALLFLPCYLGERRRVLDRLRTHIAPSEAA